MSDILDQVNKELRKKSEEKIYYIKARVRCLDDGIVYSSLTQAAEMTGCSKSHISAVCNGKLKTAKGLRFVFEDEHAIEARKNKEKKTEKRPYNKVCEYLGNRRRYEEVDWVNQKSVNCLETGETYKSARDAARQLKISVSTVLRNCNINDEIEDMDDYKSTKSGYTFTFE